MHFLTLKTLTGRALSQAFPIGVPARELRKKAIQVVSHELNSLGNESTALAQTFSDTLNTNDDKSRFSGETTKSLDKEKLSTFTVTNVYQNEKESQEPKRKIAMDIALKLRKEKGRERSIRPVQDSNKEDPVKRAIASLMMPDLTRLSDEDLAKLIRKHLVYADEKLVIFNKPYGVPIHDGDGVTQNIKNVLHMVSKMIYGVTTDIPLTLCHRLDAYTTGVTVCTTDKEMAQHIQKMFREHRILRKYWAVTLGLPDPAAGVIDIPMDRKILGKDGNTFARMVVNPEVRFDGLTGRETKVHARGHMAITNYKTLDFAQSVSLVELQPQTSVKHQLRVHLADGLDCPILGDHKYSHRNKLAPQILPPKILKRYGIPHSKSRYTPLHLHLQSLLIPDVFPDEKKRHLIVGARMPHHFGRTLNLFGLKPGVPTEWKNIHCTSPKQRAKPRKEGSDLYEDPTIDADAEERTSSLSIDDDSIKVFRKNYMRVKYKHH